MNLIICSIILFYPVFAPRPIPWNERFSNQCEYATSTPLPNDGPFDWNEVRQSCYPSTTTSTETPIIEDEDMEDNDNDGQENCAAICNENGNVNRRLAITLTPRDQRAHIAISVEAGIPCWQVVQTLNRALKNNAYKRRTIETYYSEYKSRKRVSTDRKPGSGSEKTATDEDHEELLLDLLDQRRTWRIEDLVEVMNVSAGSISFLLHKNGFRKIGPVWLPHELTDEDKQKRYNAAEANLQWFRTDARMLGRIIAIDETWVRAYTPLDPQQAQEWRKKGEKPYVNDYWF